MAITVKLDPQDLVIDPTLHLLYTTEVTGQTPGSTLTYAWTVDGNLLPTEVRSDLEFGRSIPGEHTIKVEVTETPTEGEPNTASDEVSLIVNPGTITGVTASISVSSESPKVGESFKVSAVVEGTLQGDTISYKWETGGTESSIDVIAVEGKTTYKCEITVKREFFNDLKMSRSKSVTVAPEEPVDPEVPEGDFHIWPLPHIDAAFMYGSWWALDEIQALTKEGKDWKTETEFKYQFEVDGFKKILADYNVVMVQESRNGRIIDREKLESGLIY